ncbi:unnamed protein product [Rotaria sordida]|uniref:Uncharacterized protein n=1 Tax=Rotaria sordida TaxID=392033 RepID=A0A819LJ97_9BILA|nr:unnamed protein product [Rotaria sordida]
MYSNIDNTSSKITSSNVTTSHEPTTTVTSINVIDYHSLIVNGINEWCLKNGRDLNLFDLKLIEGIDYLLTIPSYNSDSALIRCGCRASARLPRQGNNFQLSNYYRHLKTGKCSMLKSKFQPIPVHDNDAHDIIDTIEQSSSEQTIIMENTQILSFDCNSSIRSKRTASSSNHAQPKKKRQRKFL